MSEVIPFGNVEAHRALKAKFNDKKRLHEQVLQVLGDRYLIERARLIEENERQKSEFAESLKGGAETNVVVLGAEAEIAEKIRVFNEASDIELHDKIMVISDCTMRDIQKSQEAFAEDVHASCPGQMVFGETVPIISVKPDS